MSNVYSNANVTTTSKKIVLVTGASSGFGRLTAEALAKAGHNVYASMRDVAGHNARNAAEMAETSKRDNVDLRAIELDVQSEPSANAAVGKIIAESGRIDVLVHNAGHMMFGPAESFTPEQFAQQYDVNVLGTQRVNRAVLPHMRKQKRGLLVWVSSSSSAGGTPPYLSPYFAAKAAMDALMLASAYVNGQLGPREGEDMLSVIPLGGHPRDLKASTTSVSNSVAGPPAAVAVTPDHRYAIAIETFAQRPSDNRTDQTFADMKVGRAITVVDISDPAKPQIVQRFDGFARPSSVSINADGTLVAIAVDAKGDGAKTPLALYRFANGRLDEAPATPSVPGWHNGDTLVHAVFHPRENILALANQTRNELSFVKVDAVAGAPTLAAYGNTVTVDKYPYVVRFTPDGRYAIANGLYWGADVQGTWNEAPRGTVVSVKLDAGKAADGSPRHALVSHAQTGVSPEGLVVSPDGTMVVTTNLERSYLPYDDPRQTFFSSITLLRFDPQSGTLTRVGDYPMDGILPESATFDASSKSLAVLSYDHYDDRHQGGSVDFWRIAHDPLDPSRIEVLKTEHSVPLQRGAHTMMLVP